MDVPARNELMTIVTTHSCSSPRHHAAIPARSAIAAAPAA
jgi:hypothetical protein